MINPLNFLAVLSFFIIILFICMNLRFISKWLPVFLLLIIWYVPGQTAAGGLFEKYLILRWLTVIVIPVIVFIQFAASIAKKKPIVFSDIALPLSIFTAVSFCSGVVNGIPIAELLGGIFLYIRYPLLFIAFINMDMSKKIYKSFTFIFLLLVILQIPECFYRFYILGIKWDHISWTLGPYGHFDLGVYMIYASTIVISSDIIKRFKFSHMVMYVSFFMIALFGEIKAFVVSMPLVAIFTILAAREKINLKKLITLLMIIIILFFSFGSVVILWGKIYKGESNAMPEILTKFIGSIKNTVTGKASDNFRYRIDRIALLTSVYRSTRNDWYYTIIGRGPGNSLAGNFFGKTGVINNFAEHNNALASIFIDSGLMGLLSYFWILVTLLVKAVKMNRQATSLEVRLISSSVIGMWFFYAVLGPFYDLVWRFDSASYVFYFYMAILYKNRYPQDENF